MTKLITLIVLLIVVYAIVKNHRRRSNRNSDSAPRQTEDMVRCSVCGIHLPRSEGLLAQGRYYCGPDHQRQQAEHR